MAQEITITVVSHGTTRMRTFKNDSRAKQWLRRLARRGTPGTARVLEERGAQASASYFGTHPVVQAWKQDDGSRYAH